MMPASKSVYGKCASADCSTLASFGPPASSERLFCAAHKGDGMVNVINPVCLHPDCLVQAAFGTPVQKRMYCSRHMQEGMLHIRKQRDIEVLAPALAS